MRHGWPWDCRPCTEAAIEAMTKDAGGPKRMRDWLANVTPPRDGGDPAPYIAMRALALMVLGRE